MFLRSLLTSAVLALLISLPGQAQVIYRLNSDDTLSVDFMSSGSNTANFIEGVNSSTSTARFSEIRLPATTVYTGSNNTFTGTNSFSNPILFGGQWTSPTLLSPTFSGTITGLTIDAVTGAIPLERLAGFPNEPTYFLSGNGNWAALPNMFDQLLNTNSVVNFDTLYVDGTITSPQGFVGDLVSTDTINGHSFFMGGDVSIGGIFITTGDSYFSGLSQGYHTGTSTGVNTGDQTLSTLGIAGTGSNAIAGWSGTVPTALTIGTGLTLTSGTLRANGTTYTGTNGITISGSSISFSGTGGSNTGATFTSGTLAGTTTVTGTVAGGVYSNTAYAGTMDLADVNITQAPFISSPADWRSGLQLGTAAIVDTGTSSGQVPMMDDLEGLYLARTGSTSQSGNLALTGTVSGNFTRSGTTTGGTVNSGTITGGQANGLNLVPSVTGQSSQTKFLDVFSRYPNATILTSGTGNPSTIATSGSHGLTTGNVVGITRHSGTAVNGQHTVTVTSGTTFTIPVNVVASGTGGTVGLCIRRNDLPLIGTQYLMSISGTTTLWPFVTNGGLRSADNLLYFGGEHTEPITSMTLDMEFIPSLTPGAISNTGFTIALSASPLLYTGTTGIQLPGRMLHMTVGRAQDISIGLGDGTGGAVWTAPAKSSVIRGNTFQESGTPLNVRQLFRIELETGKMRVFHGGDIWLYEDPRFNSDLIGRWWWYEVTGDVLAGSNQKEVPVLYNIWLNSQTLDSLPGYGSQPYSELLTKLTMRTAMFQQGVQILGDSAFTYGTPTAGLKVMGNTYAEGKFNSRPLTGDSALFGSTYLVQTIPDAFSSSTSAADQVAVGFTARILPQDGDYEETVIYGYFANNANAKRVKLTSTGTTDPFDTGSITTANTEFELIIRKTKMTSATTRYNVKYTLSGSAPVISYTTSNYGSLASMWLRVSGVAAGDVIIRNATQTIGLRP